MKGVKQREMTTQDMAAAVLIVNRESVPKAAAQVGLHERVLRNRVKQPYFKAYMDELRRKTLEDVKAKSTPAITVNITFTRDDAAAGYLEVRHDHKVSHSNKIRALDSLVALYGIAKQSVVTPPAPGAAPDPEKPSFYRSAWREPVQ